MSVSVTLAQVQLPVGTAAPEGPKNLKITKPQTEKAVLIHLDGNVVVDLTDFANENISLVRVGNNLVILFDNKSTVTLEPFYNDLGQPLDTVSFQLAADRQLSGTQFAAEFPISTDTSILPAAGESAPPVLSSSATFSSSTVDPLVSGLNGSSETTGPAPVGTTAEGAVAGAPAPTSNATFGGLTGNPDTNAGDPVTAGGVNPGNAPFAGDPNATGNVLANDVDTSVATTAVVGVVAGSGAAAVVGNVGTTINGAFGAVVIGGDGTWTYVLNESAAGTRALAQGEVGSDVFTYTARDSLGNQSTTTLTIAVTGANDAPTVSGPVVNSVSEDAAAFAVDLLANASDVDHGAVLHVENVSAVPGGVTLSGNSLLVDTAAFQYLAQGETSVITVTYDVVDEFGASPAGSSP